MKRRYYPSSTIKEEWEDKELFKQHFVRFDEIDQKHEVCIVVEMRGISNPKNLTDMFNLTKSGISGEIAEWCKENKIIYRKVRVDDFVITSADGERLNWGDIKIGLFFYKKEDAMAFRLKWC